MPDIAKLAILLALLASSYAVPETRLIPVAGARPADWNPQAFWHYPWGRSVVHKGIDIFARKGMPVLAATGGVTLYAGNLARGGRVILLLGPKWHLHYYAHLQQVDVGAGQFVRSGEAIGTVGATGNAQGKAPHLHYSIMSLLPIPSNYGFGKPLGWLRMFYIDPHGFLISRDA
ncbi:M23 family metallopeptidase [Candidatus Methylomicrobium oryzae]|uniref:M23 family metallopeptidase n=1 Tax=Candidatus Methylomicrobium oryzae TaxID=2802053 RepID=UPI00192268C9|nr:M23 family metallopeptidase [Methylomicrobium sp. RS1]MBL1264552.1 M23 family metallopeptidase [Methylomicrobium sp. RS1]